MNAEENRLFEELMTWREEVFRICLGSRAIVFKDRVIERTLLALKDPSKEV